MFELISIYRCVIIISVMAENQRIQPHILDRFKIQKKLGSGAYGHVWRISNTNGEVFALKKVFEAFQHCTDAQRTFRQISVLKKLQHPNIIKLHEVLPSQSGRDVYLVFEYMSTDLYHAIYESTLQEVHRKYIIYQLLIGLYYLHSARLIHRDLKPSNLLLSPQCQLKLCDFGLVRHMGNQEEQVAVMTEGVATRWYRAPELLLGSQKYDEKVDLWSVGCILAEMIIKSPIFNCNSTLSHLERVLQVTGRPTSEEIEQVGVQGAAGIIRQCGSTKQKSTKQLFGVGVDENCIDLLLNLLRFSSSKRFSAEQALRHPYLKDFFRESDLRTFKGEIKLQTDDNVKLSTEAYRDLISKHFIERRQPQRFSDLKRQKSFGKALGDMSSRKPSTEKERQRKNLHLFQEILREKENSLKHARNKSTNMRQTKDKQNVMPNKEHVRLDPSPNLDQFNPTKAVKPAGTFAALRKAANPLQFRR